MRVSRSMILLIGTFGASVGLGTSVNAAPMPVTGIVGEKSRAPSVAEAYPDVVRRRYCRRRYDYRGR